MTNAAPDALRFSLVEADQDFLALREDWDALYRAQPDALGSQAFAWCWTCWRELAKPGGRSLAILVGRRGGAVALIWPLVRFRRGAWRILRPLGTESTEYSQALKAPDGAAQNMRASLDWLSCQRAADVLFAPFVPENATLNQAIVAEGLFTHAHREVATELSWDKFPSWDAYLKTLSAKRLSNIRRCRKRLEERGSFVSAPIEGPAALKEAIHWLVAQKRDWLERTHHRADWLMSPAYETCLCAAAEASDPPIVAGRTMRLDGAIIAASVQRLGASRVEAVMFAYDRDYAAYGPGELMMLDELRWAFERGLAVDFRIGDEPYKQHFGVRPRALVSYDCALSAWGGVYVALKTAKNAGVSAVSEKSHTEAGGAQRAH